MQRRLAAILSADVHGYSRLMGEDEEDTVRALTAHRDVIAHAVGNHGGRVVDSPGDNVLAEFPSVVDAVRCAVAVQADLETRNAERLEHRRMRFRMGVNLGDIIMDGARIYGDGVNIAARVEGLAAPGAVCISASAYEQVKGKLPVTFEPLGEHTVKNISEPIRVYRVLALAAPTASRAPAAADRTARTAPAGSPPLGLPERPSIAVLPFANMSGDPEQGYFADGITEDLITALSNLYGLIVIARHSVFSYKGRILPVQQVGREQGVRYVLEGSVRRSGDRVRITAQLVDAATGVHLWAERYDRELRDVFSVQDDITRRVVTELDVTLSEGEQARLWRRSTESIEAYESKLRAVQHLRLGTVEGTARCRELCERAVVLDPRFTYAHVLLGWTHFQDARFGWMPSARASLVAASECVTRAIALDESLADAYALSANLLVLTGEHERAASEAERAVALNPSGADAMIWAANALTNCGRAAEALALLERARRLCPILPPYFRGIRGLALLRLRRDEEALAEFREGLNLIPRALAYLTGVAIVAGRLGREDAARTAVRAALDVQPTWSIAQWTMAPPFDPAEREAEVEILRRVGLPDGS